jgi:hypothetical protein
MTMAMFLLGAMQFIYICPLGKHVGRIYEEVKSYPLFTIKELGKLTLWAVPSAQATAGARAGCC